MDRPLILESCKGIRFLPRLLLRAWPLALLSWSLALLSLSLALVAWPQAAAAEGTAMILYGNQPAFENIMQGLTDDLKGDLTFVRHPVTQQESADRLQRLHLAHKPDVVVLIGNHAVSAFHRWQKAFPETRHPPVIALGALYMDKLLDDFPRAIGIRYEIPAVTSAVQLRTLLGGKLARIGVIYRRWNQSFVDENAAFLAAEGFELVKFQVTENAPLNLEIRRGLLWLAEQNIGALWVVNDNQLLSRKAIIQGWLPYLPRLNMPVVVGVRSLIQKRIEFGSFALLPDHYNLGAQAADLVAEAMDNAWQLDGKKILQPISVHKLVNLSELSRRNIPWDHTVLNQIDEVIE